MLRLSDQDEQKKPGLYECVSTHCNDPIHEFVDRLSRAAQIPEVGWLLWESMLGRVRSDKGTKEFLNVEMGIDEFQKRSAPMVRGYK
jgi:hypothetical protein